MRKPTIFVHPRFRKYIEAFQMNPVHPKDSPGWGSLTLYQRAEALLGWQYFKACNIAYSEQVPAPRSRP